MAILVAASAYGESQPDPWLILLGSETGPLNVHTTKADLVRAYGKQNVVDRDVDIGEGETEPGTVVFPDDPKRLIEILWKGPADKRVPKLVTIRGATSLWKTAHDISLGTSLKDLERLNGRPFHLAGFSWDYSGTIISWDGGLLEKEFRGHGRVILRLDAVAPTGVTEDELSQVAGDRDFSSQHNIMQNINPRVYDLQWEFP